MVQIAQLDDEKQALVYQTEDLKDKLEDGEDACTEARYELKEKNKEIDRLKRQNKTLENEIQQYKEAIEYRDNFIAEKGLSLFEDTQQEENSSTECDGGNTSTSNEENLGSTSPGENKTISNSNDPAGRRASVSDDKEVLVDQIKILQSQVADMKTAGVDRRHLEVPTQDELEDIRREFARQVNDMKIKVHKMEQENTRLEGLVMRLESQVKRYKSQAEAAEATEESLKTEKRKLQRELRKAQDDIIEIQTAHDHIQKRTHISICEVATSLKSDNFMEERNRIRYETLFYCQKLEDGFLSGDNARALFIRSKLPLLDLTRIWKLSDITRDNKLDVFEFSLAMHFIELKLMGGEIPKQNDIAIADNNHEVVFPIITEEEKQQIQDIFEYADGNSQGFLEIDIVKPMLLSSGLSPSTLSSIWNIADLDRAGKLCLFDFTIAMHLVKNC
ncbi:Leucine-rich repeat flightless-interacting 2, partial [Paramuricea clavata]